MNTIRLITSFVLLFFVSGCTGEKEEEYYSQQFVLFFYIFLAVIFSFLLYALFRHHFKKKKTDLNSNPISEEKRYYVTSPFDDFYPIARQFKIESEPKSEDKHHQRLNYHYIIEKLTRKMFFLLIAIALFTVSFAYLLYDTSYAEHITPEQPVMDNYKIMMADIMSVEDDLEQHQINRLDSLEGLDSVTRNSLKEDILKKATDNEDKLVYEVNQDFFKIYYWRYAIVRFVIAFVIIGFIRYLMALYMKMRADRNDLIRKEEALSILFHMLEDMNKNGDKSIYGNILKDKIPMFPLRILFTSPDSKRKKNEQSSQVESVLEELMEMHGKSIESIERLARAIEKK